MLQLLMHLGPGGIFASKEAGLDGKLPASKKSKHKVFSSLMANRAFYNDLVRMLDRFQRAFYSPAHIIAQLRGGAF